MVKWELIMHSRMLRLLNKFRYLVFYIQTNGYPLFVLEGIVVLW